MEGQPGDALATATQLRWFGMTQTTHELGRLSWLDGRVLLPPFDPMKRDSIAVQVFAGVASELGASVVGDEGETYEL